MMYSEFVKGTGCKENDHNYKVFKDLEVMYMNSDLTKEQIYEYGKKLVDNSKSEKELVFEAKMKERIEELKTEIENDKAYIAWKTQLMQFAKENGNKEDERYYKSIIQTCQRRIIDYRREIAACRQAIEG